MKLQWRDSPDLPRMHRVVALIDEPIERGFSFCKQYIYLEGRKRGGGTKERIYFYYYFFFFF